LLQFTTISFNPKVFIIVAAKSARLGTIVYDIPDATIVRAPCTGQTNPIARFQYFVVSPEIRIITTALTRVA